MKLQPLAYILTLLVVGGAFGEVRAGRFLYLPYIAPAPWETQLIATNDTESDQTIFVRFLQSPGLSEERAYVLPARSTQEIALPGEIDSQAAYLEKKEGMDLALSLRYRYQREVAGFRLNETATSRLILDRPLSEGVDWTGLAVTNLSARPQVVTVTGVRSSGSEVSRTELEIPAYGTETRLLQELFESDRHFVRYLRISGELRLTAMLLERAREGYLSALPSVPAAPAELKPDPEAAYFLVAWPRRGVRQEESYILKLTDEEAIDEARALLVDGTTDRIVTGTISAGSGGFNRNLLQEGSPLFSWHISEFTGFAEFAIEVCDGGPVDVELDVEYWLQQVGQVCFWTPTVVRELNVDEVRRGRLEP